MHRYMTLILQSDIQESDCIYQNFQKKRNVQKFAKKCLLNSYRYPQLNNQELNYMSQFMRKLQKFDYQITIFHACNDNQNRF